MTPGLSPRPRRAAWNWLGHFSRTLPRFLFRWRSATSQPSSRRPVQRPPVQRPPVQRPPVPRRPVPRSAPPLAFEPLERRALLVAFPIANPDLNYQLQSSATQLSVPAASGLLANDYDLDTPASSLRIAAAWGASGGTLSWASDGSFTFTRAANFSGIASFLYQTSDGTRTSYPAEVNIAFDAPFAANLLASEHASGNLLHAGAWSTQMQVSPDWNYLYRSDTVAPLPVLAVESLYAGTPAGRSVTSIRSELFRGSTRVSQASYTQGVQPLAAGTRLRFALQDETAAALPTGRYDYSFKLTVNYDNQTSRSVSYALSKSLVNRSNEGSRVTSQFGQGWWLEGLDQLHLQSGGALWVQDNGDAFWFPVQGSGYGTAPGDQTFSTLARPGNGNQFVLTDKWGNTKTFELGSGNLARLTQVKALNNVSPTWRYFYDTAGRLTTIRDEYNRAWEFQQQGEFTSKLIDHSGRAFTFDYEPTDPGVLVRCRWPQPNVVVDPALEVPETVWTCGTGAGRLLKLTDPRGVTTEPIYNRFAMVEGIRHGDLTELLLSPMLQQGLVSSLTTGAAVHVVFDAPNPLNGNWPWIRSERGQTSYFKTNEFGAVTGLVDADGHRSDWAYSNRNLLFRLSGADPDGTSGPLVRPLTQLGHNYWGDLVLVRNPDGSSRSAAWNTTLHRPLSITNELGQVERFGYDAAGNQIFRQDATNRRWDFVYDQTLTSAADRHGRLLEVQSPDPDGSGPLPRLVTKYEYEPAIWHRISRIRNSDDTAAQPSFRSFTYNQRDELTSETNELGQSTSYTPDHHGRLRMITLPPDASGLSGTILRRYNPLGQLIFETNPLGHGTQYEFDPSRGWLNSVKQFSAGGTLLATTAYRYFADGLLQTKTLPSYTSGAAERYRYDGRGNLIEVTSPSGGIATMQYDGLGRLTSSRAASGREQRFVYDIRDRLIEARDHDPDGAGPLPAPATRYEYDLASRTTRVSDPLGRATVYAYLANGWLSQVTLPDPDGALGPASGAPVYYAYNHLGQVTSVTAPAGRVTETTYDNRARVASVTRPDPDGTGPLVRPQLSYQYDRADRLVAQTDQLGRRSDYSYDARGLLLSVTLPDADGNPATSGDRPRYQYAYDLAGNLIKTIDPLLGETLIELDGLARPDRVLQPDADRNPLTLDDRPEWRYRYGENTLLAAVVDPLGRLTNYEYDSFGRQTALLEPSSDGSTSLASRAVTRYQYDVLDRLSRTIGDPDGGGALPESRTTYGYDIYSRLETTTDARGQVTRYGYDLAGQLTSLRDPSGNETLWAYDGLGQRKLESNQLGHSRFFEYDIVGNLLRRTDRSGRLIQSTYDLLDRQTSESWHASRATARVATTREGGNGVNEVQTITVSGLSVTGDRMQLAFGGEVTRILPFSASAAGVKSALDELRDIDNVSVTLSTSGTTRTYTVTFAGSLAGKNVPLIQAVAMPATNGAQQNRIDYKYNAAGLLAEGGDASAQYSWGFDRLDRRTSETADFDPANPLNSLLSLTQAYDLAGNRSELAARFTDFAAGGSSIERPDFRNVYQYDGLNRLSSIQQTALGGAGGSAVAGKLVRLNYNRLGQLSSLGRFESSTPSGPELRTSWTYDGANRLATLTHASVSGTAAPATLQQYGYQYDLLNRITGLTSTRDGASSFSYDPASQLTSATHASPRVPEAYQYDASGNRTGGAQQVGVNNQTLGDDKYTYQYDAEGNRTRRMDRASGAIEDYTWDHRNRLTKITFRTSAGVETRSIEYRYDLLNRLVLRRLDSNGAATAGGVSDLWLAGYDGINPTFALSSLSSTAVTNRYLWGPGVDFLLADEQLTSSSSPGNTLWPLGDHLGTLRDLADFSGTSFAITNHRVFDTFGRLLSESNASVDTHFAFTGKFFDDLGDTDPSSSLSHHWNRWYDPQLGKWLSEDPIGFAGGDVNLGRYIGNYATGGRDWSGLYQDGGGQAPQIPSGSLPPGTEVIIGEDIIGLGVPVPPGIEGRKGTVACPTSETSAGTGTLDWLQGGLDVAGTVEPTPCCDILNSVICIFRGKWEDAGLTIMGVVPYVGDTGKAIKNGKKLVEGAVEVADTVKDLSKTTDLSKAASVVEETVNIPAAKTLQPTSDVPKGIVYKRTDLSGKIEPYGGQATSQQRFIERQAEHARIHPESDFDFEIVDRARPGEALDVAEHNFIQELTGGVKARKSPLVSNKKDPVGPARRSGLGLPEPRDF